MANRDLHPRGRKPKRVLAVRMLIAKIAWLDAPLIWNNGRVCWKTQNGLFAPAPSDLARAQHTLYKIRQYPISAELALQDREAWTVARTVRLEHAKLLHTLEAPDLTTLSRPANARNPRAVERLVQLLIAEALCLNDLPISPVRTLVAWGEVVESPLQRLIADAQAPLEARTLGALALGTLHGKRSVPSWPVATPGEEESIRHAYGWGRRSGLPAAPCLALALLADVTGEALVQRYTQALSQQSRLAFPVETLRAMLFRGATPTQVVEIVEALAEAEPLAKRILTYRDRLPKDTRNRQDASQQLASQRQEILNALQAVFVVYAQRTLDARIVSLITRFVAAMLDQMQPESLADVIVCPLHGGLELPSPLLRSYLELLVERCSTIWPPEEIDSNRVKHHTGRWQRIETTVMGVRGWIQRGWGYYGKPIREVLHGSQDADLVREAMDRNLLQNLGEYAWEEPGMYRCALACARVVLETDNFWLANKLCSVIDLLGSAALARSALQPLLASLRSVPTVLRQELLVQFFDRVPETRTALSTVLPQLARFVPLFEGYTTRARQAVSLCYCVDSLLTLQTKIGEETEAWFCLLLTSLLDLEREGAGLIREESVGTATLLAVTLAEGDPKQFSVIFRALVRRSIQQGIQRLERGVEALAKYPKLRPSLSVIFPQQPERCALLLMRIGLATHLGSEALTPLAALTPESTNLLEEGVEERAEPMEGDWGELLALLPEFAEVVAGFRHAQKLLARSEAMPPGVRRALELPRRMTQELAFLERSSDDASPNPELQARVLKLRQSLSRPEEITEVVRTEVGKRLKQITAQVQIDAAEQQVLECYRQRLESVAGPLPPDLDFDINLQNATLLTADIEQNRRLLQRLLRAHIEGRPHWREAHPANAAFLQQLAAQGVDTRAWLGAHPRRYPCKMATGRQVRLHLEQNPLHILQMGNYFDTCLSFGGFNAFSTVANACELNKRVVYAADGMGRIVGRKLIGINAEGKLIGFHTYTSMTDEAGNKELVAIFRRYLGLFAECCGLEMADEGTIPTLFAEAWYDDGVVPWTEEETSFSPHSSQLSMR